MAKSFRGGKELHDLIESAPIEPLLDLLERHGIERPTGGTEEAEPREKMISAIDAADADQLLRAKDSAQRILPFGEPKNSWIINRVLARQLNLEPASFAQTHEDELGRAIWGYLNARAAFDDAEAVLHSIDQRAWGKSYSSFEVVGPGPAGFGWNDNLERALRDRIVAELDLKESPRLTHLLVRDETAKSEPVHIVIVRFGGPTSSVAEYRTGGEKGRHYYQRPDEVTVLYTPNQGTVEVCADSPSARFDVASAFAEAALGQDLSAKPLLLKNYDLSRFYESLALPDTEPEGYAVQRAQLVEISVLPGHSKRRATLRVPPEEEIAEVADRLFGPANIFRRASAISQLIFSVTYWPTGSSDTKSFRFNVSYPNRSNLPSNPNLEQRGLGYALLEAWGVLKPLRIPDAVDLQKIFPVLLELYDQATESVPESYFSTRGIDVDRLASAGFISARGRYADALIEEEDDEEEVASIRPSAIPGAAEYTDHTGRTAVTTGTLSRKFAVDRRWIEEQVQNGLKPALTAHTPRYPHPRLAHLGDLQIGGQSVPCHFACGLDDIKTLNAIDLLLGGERENDGGVVLVSSSNSPICLGRSVCVSLPDCLATDGTETTIDQKAVEELFSRNAKRCRGLADVELRENAGGTATLIMPQRSPWTVVGHNQVLIVRRLVDAYQTGSPAVVTGHLVADTGVGSPRQAFRGKQLAAFLERVEKPGNKLWQLRIDPVAKEPV